MGADHNSRIEAHTSAHKRNDITDRAYQKPVVVAEIDRQDSNPSECQKGNGTSKQLAIDARRWGVLFVSKTVPNNRPETVTASTARSRKFVIISLKCIAMSSAFAHCRASSSVRIGKLQKGIDVGQHRSASAGYNASPSEGETSRDVAPNDSAPGLNRQENCASATEREH